MKQTLSNLIIYGDLEQNVSFYFKGTTKIYRYVSYSLHNTIGGKQKMLVIAFNLVKLKYEILDISIDSKLYKKEVILIQ